MDFFPPEAYWRELRKRRMVLPPGQLHPSFEAFNKYLEGYADAYTLKMRREELQLKIALLKARVAAIEVLLPPRRTTCRKWIAVGNGNRRLMDPNADAAWLMILFGVSNAPLNAVGRSTGRWAVFSSITV
jgi:hypothetical protein